MTDVYQKLAKHLDQFPGGFPPTESGVELRILKRLFTPEEAEVAMAMTLRPEPPGAVAARMGRDEAELASMLESMSRKGLIFRASKGSRHFYMAAQFVVGIWEYHLNDLDEGLIKDVNEYIPYVMDNVWLKGKTKQMRVVPVSESITPDMSIMPYDSAEELIRSKSKIVVSPCICRKEHEMVGEGCGKPMEACFSFGTAAFYYEGNGLGRSVTVDEALEILESGKKAGLVLQPSNSQNPINICMCCGCCCQVLKNMNRLEKPARVIHSNYYAEVKEDNCTACEACVDICQMKAIAVEDTAEVNLDRCIGCGLCVMECPSEALVLKQKAETEQYTPPKTVVDTYTKIAIERRMN